MKPFLLTFLFAAALSALHAAPPPGWTAQNVGSPTTPGTVTFTEATGAIAVTGPGHSIDYGADKFQFISQSLQGDGEIIARVASLTNPASYQKGGLMLRTSLAANSPFVEIFAGANDGVSFRYRPTAGINVVSDSHHGDKNAPVWIKLARLGSRVMAFTSANGIVWTDLGSTDAVTLPATLYAGFYGNSTTSGGGGVATFDALSVRRSEPVPLGTTVSLIGSSIAAGTATAVVGGNGAFVLSSDGGNLFGENNGFLFFHVPFSGDGEIRARVTGLSAVAGGSNIGLMVRDSLQPNALYASIAVYQDSLRRQHLTEVDGNPTDYSVSGAPMVWLKMARHGALFSAFSSADGLAWQPMGKPFAIGLGPNVLFGLTLVGGANWPTPFAQATVDSITWPTPAPAGPAIDPVIAAGLVSWRKPDGNGVRCVDCHTPFAYDIAQFSFNRADLRLATTPHLTPTDADAIFDMIEKLRVQYPPVGGLKNFRTFRPMQPGGGQIIGGENADPNVRDAAFGFYMKDHFKIAQDRIVTLAQARAAGQELIDVDTKTVPIGIKFNLWSRSVLREGPVNGGEVAEWLPAVGTQPIPAFQAYWFQLQDDYLRDPSDDNFWAIYHATSLWTQPDAHNFVAGTTHNNWRYIAKGQYLANSLLAHDELRKARGLPSTLAAQDGVRPFPGQRGISGVELAPFWNVGDNARVVQSGGFNGMPVRNKESVYIDPHRSANNGSEAADQIDDLRLTWFWLGWTMDNSLHFSGEGSTLSGEYFIGSLWSGDVDNINTGNSDSLQGYRMHQVFFNAVQQFKLGYKPGAWRDDDGTQHFEASKGYYLGYYRWHPRAEYEQSDIGLPGANALYKRMLSNHIRMAMLIHADEARKAGGVYFNENFTLADLALWRGVLNWADPQWTQADEALLAELKSSLAPPLTAAELDDRDHDGQMSIVETALGTSPDAANPATSGSLMGFSPLGALSVTFTRVRADYSYVVEASTDLLDWTVLATNPGTVGVPVTVEDTASLTLPRRFVRLRIINARP